MAPRLGKNAYRVLAPFIYDNAGFYTRQVTEEQRKKLANRAGISMRQLAQALYSFVSRRDHGGDQAGWLLVYLEEIRLARGDPQIRLDAVLQSTDPTVGFGKRMLHKNGTAIHVPEDSDGEEAGDEETDDEEWEDDDGEVLEEEALVRPAQAAAPCPAALPARAANSFALPTPAANPFMLPTPAANSFAHCPGPESDAQLFGLHYEKPTAFAPSPAAPFGFPAMGSGVAVPPQPFPPTFRGYPAMMHFGVGAAAFVPLPPPPPPPAVFASSSSSYGAAPPVPSPLMFPFFASPGFVPAATCHQLSQAAMGPAAFPPCYQGAAGTPAFGAAAPPFIRGATLPTIPTFGTAPFGAASPSAAGLPVSSTAADACLHRVRHPVQITGPQPVHIHRHRLRASHQGASAASPSSSPSQEATDQVASSSSPAQPVSLEAASSSSPVQFVSLAAASSSSSRSSSPALLEAASPAFEAAFSSSSSSTSQGAALEASAPPSLPPPVPIFAGRDEHASNMPIAALTTDPAAFPPFSAGDDSASAVAAPSQWGGELLPWDADSLEQSMSDSPTALLGPAKAAVDDLPAFGESQDPSEFLGSVPEEENADGGLFLPECPAPSESPLVGSDNVSMNLIANETDEGHFNDLL